MRGVFFITFMIASAGATMAGTDALYADALAWTGHVYYAIIGDSIPAGGGGAGVGTRGFPLAISNACGNRLIGTNGSFGGAHWTNASPNATPDMVIQLAGSNADLSLGGVLIRSPRWVFINSGRNDLLTCFITNQVFPCYWPVLEATMNLCASKATAAGAKLLIGEVLPAYTNFSSPDGSEWSVSGIRLLNNAYSNWCNTNIYSANTRFAPQHDAFAVSNPATGNLDWLNGPYQQSVADGLHLSQAAYDFWGPLLVSNLASAYLTTNQIGGNSKLLGNFTFQ